MNHWMNEWMCVVIKNVQLVWRATVECSLISNLRGWRSRMRLYHYGIRIVTHTVTEMKICNRCGAQMCSLLLFVRYWYRTSKSFGTFNKGVRLALPKAKIDASWPCDGSTLFYLCSSSRRQSSMRTLFTDEFTLCEFLRLFVCKSRILAKNKLYKSCNSALSRTKPTVMSKLFCLGSARFIRFSTWMCFVMYRSCEIRSNFTSFNSLFDSDDLFWFNSFRALASKLVGWLSHFFRLLFLFI